MDDMNAGGKENGLGVHVRSPLVSKHPPSPLRAVSVNSATSHAAQGSSMRKKSGRRPGLKRSKSASTTGSKPVETICVGSIDELEKKFNGAAKALRGDDWAKRVDAIKRIHGLVEGGALASYTDEFLELLRVHRGAIVKQIADLRSLVVREACRMVAA